MSICDPSDVADLERSQDELTCPAPEVVLNTLLAWLAAGASAVTILLLWRGLRRARRAARRAMTAIHDLRRDLDRRNLEVARLRASLGGASDGLIVLDHEQRIVAWNASAGELAGRPTRLGPGRAVAEVLPWGQLGEALVELGGDGAGATLREFELSGVAVDDDPDRVLRVAVRALSGLGYVIAVEDQSRIKQLESLLRDFVANVSHELKTPLAAIKGYVETMIDDTEMAEATRSRFLDRIARQTERLNSLVGDLLTLSRLDEEELVEGGDRHCDLVQIVQETMRDLVSLAERKNLDVHTQIVDAELPVRADREALRQVVGNLIDNAIKYTPDEGRLDVRLARDGAQARFEVADTGIGLSPEDQERVFERFYRVDRARSRELGGTGLGLSIVKNTVRGLGGDVGVHSAVGRGATFWVTLPCVDPGAGADAGAGLP